MSVSGEGTAPVPEPGTSAWRRILGFTLIPALAAISPLAVLPILARTVGESGWASAIAGEAVGSFAAIALAYGWVAIGPALVAGAVPDERGRLYRQSIVVRVAMSAIALPFTALVCALVAGEGHELLAVLMGLQGALISISFTWFAVGLGTPGAIIAYDAVPRLAASALSALAVGLGAAPILFPLSGIAVTMVGTTLYSVRVLRRFPGRWPSLHEVPSLFRRGAPVVLTEGASGAYSSVPVPLVTATASAGDAAAYATADKLVKLGLFLPITLANAFQAWTGEARGAVRARRIRFSLGAHILLGVCGWIFLATVGEPVSRLLFDDAAASGDLLTIVGLAFASFSIRTSMMRHILFPAGLTRIVFAATLGSSLVGLPVMIGANLLFGPLGAALGYALIEFLATVLLIPRSISAYRRLVAPAQDIV